MKLKNTNCDETKNSDIMKLKNPKCSEKKNQTLMKLNSNGDKTQKLKL